MDNYGERNTSFIFNIVRYVSYSINYIRNSYPEIHF